LLEKLFVKRSRKQLKSKFKREEKENPRRIDEALKNTIPIDIDHYHTAINQAAEKKKLLEEQRDQASAQTQQASAKGDNDSSHETPTTDTTPQKTNNADTDKLQVDEIELDEETLASFQDDHYYASYNMDNYEEVDE